MFEHQVRVIFGDTDAAGIVYHATYLRYLESARGELLRAAGIPYRTLEARGHFWPVVELHTRFRKPARHDDLLRIQVWVSELAGASVTFAYRVLDAESGALLCEAETRLGSSTLQGGVTRLPGEVRSALVPFTEGPRAGAARRGAPLARAGSGRR